MTSLFSRAAITAGLATGTLLLGGGIASAHVSVTAPDAVQGGSSLLTFRVPAESDTASTTAVAISLPNLNSARPEPLAGWTASIQKDPTSDLITGVTWTANPGAGTPPGQFQQFFVTAGPLPKTASVEFPALQTYSDGSTVDWNQEPLPGGGEPEHPAPEITLAAATGAADDGDGDAAAPTTAVTASAQAAPMVSSMSSSGTSDSTARWLGGGGLVLGALGAALGIGSVVRGRRS